MPAEFYFVTRARPLPPSTLYPGVQRFARDVTVRESWRKPEPERSSAAQTGRERLPARSTTKRARNYRAERYLAKHRPMRIATPDLPKTRGDFVLVSVENPDSDGPRRVIAQCTGQYCADAPNTARFEVSEWIGVKSKGRHSCGLCARHRRAAIQRAINARSRGNVPAVIA